MANAIGRVAPKEIGRIVKSGGIEVIDYATLPEAPYSSTSLVKYALVGFAGCFGASFVLFLPGRTDGYHDPQAVRTEAAFRIPVLGDIPQIQAPDRKSKPVLVLGENSSFAVKESYNTIRANLLFTGKGERCPVYAVTSADKDEGKTLNSVNIAISYAQLGKKSIAHRRRHAEYVGGISAKAPGQTWTEPVSGGIAGDTADRGIPAESGCAGGRRKSTESFRTIGRRADEGAAYDVA